MLKYAYLVIFETIFVYIQYSQNHDVHLDCIDLNNTSTWAFTEYIGLQPFDCL